MTELTVAEKQRLAACWDPDVAQIFIDRGDLDTQCQLAEDPRTAPTVLGFLAVHGERQLDLLEALAANEHTPPDGLAALGYAALDLDQVDERLGAGLLIRSDLPSVLRRLLENPE